MNDIINALFELVGAILCWRNFVQLMRDHMVRGVYWPATAFFALWGLWNLWYYPNLGQWYSFFSGLALCSGNAAWVLVVLIELRKA